MSRTFEGSSCDCRGSCRAGLNASSPQFSLASPGQTEAGPAGTPCDLVVCIEIGLARGNLSSGITSHCLQIIQQLLLCYWFTCRLITVVRSRPGVSAFRATALCVRAPQGFVFLPQRHPTPARSQSLAVDAGTVCKLLLGVFVGDEKAPVTSRLRFAFSLAHFFTGSPQLLPPPPCSCCARTRSLTPYRSIGALKLCKYCRNACLPSLQLWRSTSCSKLNRRQKYLKSVSRRFPLSRLGHVMTAL